MYLESSLDILALDQQKTAANFPASHSPVKA